MLVRKFLPPIFLGPSATPSINNAIAVTNYGEIVRDLDSVPYHIYAYDDATGSFYIFDLDDPNDAILNPDKFQDYLHRFVDTSSNIDIVGFKHSILNLPGEENPKFSLKIYSSKTANASDSEWQQIAFVESTNTILFLTNVSRYIKFVIDFETESDLSSSDLLFLVQVNIDEITVPVITDHARTVLSRFPSWTKIYSDSLERATPELAFPQSEAGKIVNALLGEDLDKVDDLISDIDFDSFISTADVNQVAWLYVCPNIRPGFIKVIGDDLELARVSSLFDLLQLGISNYAFYYDFVSQDLYSLRPFKDLYVDLEKVQQIPIQNYNSFDEFGLKVGLQRLYLESNINFKKRILDVYINPPALDIEGLKRTLRRELDIWRAYGATPDSNYLGATPEIIEMSDLQKYGGTYYDEEGNPNQGLYPFVEDINVRFPSNFGYAKWGEAYWDYAGRKQEGVSSIPQVVDVGHVSPEYFQPGIGDFDDAKIVLKKIEKEITEYSFDVKIKGIKSESTESAYEPLDIQYDSYVSYQEYYIDNDYATINYDLTLELAPHGDLSASVSYTANITDIVKNSFSNTSSSSPEYIIKDIFEPTEFTKSSIVFKDESGTPYFNTLSPSATESYSLNQIPLYAVQQATVAYKYARNGTGATGDYAWIYLNNSTPNFRASSSNLMVTKKVATPSYKDFSLEIGSKIYSPTKMRVSETPKIRSSIFGNTVNESTKISQQKPIQISPSSIRKNFLLPSSAIPMYVHIDNIVSGNFDSSFASSPNQNYGGISNNRQTNSSYLIPSSPNILFKMINPDFATPQMHQDYIGTSSSTVSYYFTKIKYPYDATPGSFEIQVQPSSYYPFSYKVWQNFEATHMDEFSFYLSENGIVKSSPDINLEINNNIKSNLVGDYTFSRSDFGLEEFKNSKNLIVKSIEIVNPNDGVKIWQENSYDPVGNQYLNFYNEQINEYTIDNIKIRAEYDNSLSESVSPSIRSGWYYFGGEEGYIYANQKTITANNSATINFEDVARNGAPVVLYVKPNSSTPIQYRQVSFYDEATPHQYSLYNFEYTKTNNNKSIFLAYDNVFDVKVVDTFTGKTLVSGLSSATNEIDLSSATPTSEREYKVTYRVKDAFYVDNQTYDYLEDQYITSVHLLSTPNQLFSATVSYESSLYDKDREISEFKLSPIYSQLDEGYVYLSHSSYDSNSVDAYVSPNKILSDGVDYMVLNLFSKDKNLNPKPNQTFMIYGNNISSTPQYVTTDFDGFGSAEIRYSGANQSIQVEDTFYVQGLPAASPNAHANSSSGLISSTVNYYVQPTVAFPSKLYAETNKKILTANGFDNLSILGMTNKNSAVYWRKARNINEAFNISYSTSQSAPGKNANSGMVYSDSSGNFLIEPFTSQNDATPGYWFVSVETELASTPNLFPVTISGDIVYWYEKYDASQSSSEEPVYIPESGYDASYSAYSEDPVFKLNPDTNSIVFDDESATPWDSLPRWYPINRFTQYQLGFFGTNPDKPTSFGNLHPDYEEE